MTCGLLTIKINNCDYYVIKMGTPLFSKASTVSLLKSVGFTLHDLTVVWQVTGTRGCVQYVIWCMLASKQKLISTTHFEELQKMTPATLVEGADTFELPCGGEVNIPRRPTLNFRVSKSTQAYLSPLQHGRFVLTDGALKYPDVVAQCDFKSERLKFEEAEGAERPAARSRSLLTFAEMLSCLSEQPSVDQLRRWASSALAQHEQ